MITVSAPMAIAGTFLAPGAMVDVLRSETASARGEHEGTEIDERTGVHHTDRRGRRPVYRAGRFEPLEQIRHIGVTAEQRRGIKQRTHLVGTRPGPQTRQTGTDHPAVGATTADDRLRMPCEQKTCHLIRPDIAHIAGPARRAAPADRTPAPG